MAGTMLGWQTDPDGVWYHVLHTNLPAALGEDLCRELVDRGVLAAVPENIDNTYTGVFAANYRDAYPGMRICVMADDRCRVYFDPDHWPHPVNAAVIEEIQQTTIAAVRTVARRERDQIMEDRRTVANIWLTRMRGREGHGMLQPVSEDIIDLFCDRCGGRRLKGLVKRTDPAV